MDFDDLARTFQPDVHPTEIDITRQYPHSHLTELDAEIMRVAGLSNAIDYKLIKLLAEFDELGGWVGDGIKSLAHWLNWRCGMGAVVAREKVRVARKLRGLPQIDAAFRRGEVGYTQVRAMTRVATEENEAYLLMIARHGTARHVEQAVRHFNACKRREARETSPEMEEYRQAPRLSWHQDEYGMYHINASLPAEQGAVVVKALNAMEDDMRREATAPDPDESDSRYKAEHEKNCTNVSRETFLRETHSCKAQPEQLTVRDQPYTCSSATALANIAEHYLASETSRVMAPGDKYQVLLHINANAAHIDCKIEGESSAYIHDDDTFLTPEVAQQLACSASITPIMEDDEGNVLNIGRRSRKPNRAISLAVQIRDNGCCRFPNCYQRKWTDAHHIISWAQGGETSAANIITLCRHHHTFIHKGEFNIERNGNTLRFQDRLGKVIERALYPQFPLGPLPDEAVSAFDRECRAQGIVIDHTTADCKWLGEIMDYDMFIQEMYRLG